MAGKANLVASKAAKNDEFYTQWNDIENEMNAYLDYNQGAFRGKTVLLPCDDPEWSNFTKYFALNFESLGLKKLISTSYAPRSKPTVEKRGRIYILERGDDANGGSRLNDEGLKWDYLQGDGDFRSDEIKALRDEADMVITNPPFSLFREFMVWLIEGDVEFAVIGNMNAAAYKEVFPHIKEGRLWRGATPDSGRIKWFRIPDDAPVKSSVQRTDPDGTRWQDVGSSVWFTNIEHGRRHEPLALMTMEDNLLYGSKRIRETAYVKYDNYDAIEVPETRGIPSDYAGVMGVPISFLDKYNPDQFEILGIAKTPICYSNSQSARRTRTYENVTQISKDGKRSGGNEVNAGPVIVATTEPVGQTHYLTDEVDGYLISLYLRILIRHRHLPIQSLNRSRGGQSSLRCKRGLSHVEVRG